MCEPDTVSAYRFQPRGYFRAAWAWLARQQASSPSRLLPEPQSDDDAPRARTNASAAHGKQMVRTAALGQALTSGQLQQVNSTTCGAATLIAARLLLQPDYAHYLLAPTHPKLDDQSKTSADDASTTTTIDAAAAAAAAADDGVRSRFAAQSAAVHQRSTQLLGRVGRRRRDLRIRLPWPRALGTPPWGVRHELTALADVRYRTVLIDPGSARSRADAFALLTDAVTEGLPAALFTGNGVLPRHVVLAVEEGLRVYDPGRGVVVRLTRSDFVDGELGAVAWTMPWAVVVPRAVCGRR